MNDSAELPDDLFLRQLGITEIGQAGQARLADARVLVIGAGGLGSPVITYLACAGVGTIIIADGDALSTSNLNRQFVHGIDDIGRNKAISAAEYARAINGASAFVAIEHFLTDKDLDEYVPQVNCVVDCVDSFEVRTMVARACMRADVPLVEGGISDLYGWVLCIDRDHACLECAGLRDIDYDTSPPVLGASVGVIGCLQALECLKILLNSPDVSFGRLINFDGRLMEMESIALARDPDCPAHRPQ